MSNPAPISPQMEDLRAALAGDHQALAEAAQAAVQAYDELRDWYAEAMADEDSDAAAQIAAYIRAVAGED